MKEALLTEGLTKVRMAIFAFGLSLRSLVFRVGLRLLRRRFFNVWCYHAAHVETAGRAYDVGWDGRAAL